MTRPTALTLLREFDEGDAEPFYRMVSDPAVIRYTGDPAGGASSVEHALEVLRSRTLADYQKYGFGRWACVLKASGEVIGFAGLKFQADLQEVSLGYRLLPAYWGQGLATEACRAVLDHGRTSLGVERIMAMVDPENVASVRVLEKLGLTLIGLMEYQGGCFAKYVLEIVANRTDGSKSRARSKRILNAAYFVRGSVR